MWRLSLFKIPIFLLGVSVSLVSDVGPKESRLTTAKLVSAAQFNQIGVVAYVSDQFSDQQKRDFAECYNIAKIRSGVDPRVLGVTVPMPSSPDSAGSTSASAAKTAGESQRDVPDPSRGQHFDASTEKGQKLIAFRSANEACLRARGYILKQPQAPPTPPK